MILDYSNIHAEFIALMLLLAKKTLHFRPALAVFPFETINYILHCENNLETLKKYVTE